VPEVDHSSVPASARTASSLRRIAPPLPASATIQTAISATGTSAAATPPLEIGGRDGPEPTRYGDWERAGRCIDF
jgi:hypothetical protein